jgi:hypothetical protein
MIIEIPVRVHVKQFLLNPAVWGSEPVKARLNSPAGKIVSALLSQYPVEAPIPRKQMKDEILAEIEDTPVPSDPLWKKGVTIKVKVNFPLNAEYITDEGLLRLGYLLEDHFELGLQFFAMGRMDVLATEQGAVKRFYSKMQIDPEKYDFDAAFKVVQRCRKKANMVK